MSSDSGKSSGGGIVNLLRSPNTMGIRESPLNSANQSKITMCSDPPLFHPESYLPDSDCVTSNGGGTANGNVSQDGSPPAGCSVTSYGPAGSSGTNEPVGMSGSASVARFEAESEEAATKGLIEAECRQVLSINGENDKFIAKKDREIETLELTKDQLTEMLTDEAGLAKDEYFDLSYMAQEVGKVWESRLVTDPETELVSSQLFPNSASSLRSIRSRAGSPHLLDPADDSSAGLENTAFEKKHPIMFRRMQVNKSRREAFNASMQEARGATDTTLTALGDNTTLQSTNLGTTMATVGSPSTLGGDTNNSGAIIVGDQAPPVAGLGGAAARTLRYRGMPSQALSISDIRAKLKAQEPLQPHAGLGAGSGKHLQSASHTTCLSSSLNSSANKGGQGKQTATTQKGAYKKKVFLLNDKVVDGDEAEKTEGDEEKTTKDDEGGNKEASEDTDKPDAPQTLSEMLKAQQKQLAHTEKRDTEVYKPLLNKFFEYEDNARSKLSKLIERCTTENEAHDEALRLDEEEKARAKKVLDEGLDE